MDKYLYIPFTQNKDNSFRQLIQILLTPRENEIMFLFIRKATLFFQKRTIDPKIFKLLNTPYNNLTSFEYMILLSRYLMNHCYFNDDRDIYYHKQLFMTLGIEEKVEKISFIEYIFRITPLLGYSFTEIDSHLKTKPTLNEFQQLVKTSFYKKIN